jgi:predicted dehydrogenase
LAPEYAIPEGFGPGYRWRWGNPKIGGGIVQDHLPHYVDLIHHWTGAQVVSVYAQHWNIARDRLGWPEEASRWEDMGLVVARFSDDFLLRFETGTVGRSLSPLWSQGSGVGEWTEYGYIFGTEGQLLFDLLPWDSSENGRIALWELNRARNTGTGWAYIEQPEPARRSGSPSGAAHAMFSTQMREFARGILGEKTRIATGEDGATGVAAVEAANRSSMSHSECEVRSPVGGRLEGYVERRN